MIVGILRTTQFAFQNVWRNLWLSFITIFILFLTTMSITLVAGLSIIGQQAISAIQDEVNIDLYFYDYVREEQILDAKGYLETQPEVSDVIYVSQEDAEADFRATHADDADILNALDQLEGNVLPASLVVRAQSIEEYPTIIERFETSEFQEFVDRTDYSDNQEIISYITQVTSRAYQIGAGVSLLLVVIAVIVIFNTIRITIYSHREEVGIMKLVGATNWFVRAPFILESVLIAVISALATIAVFGLLLYFSDPMITSFFAGYDFSIYQFFLENIGAFILFELAGAALLSVVSSMIAITRHLRA